MVHEDVAALATISGSVNIVNAPGGATTSVVLVPSSVYDEALERGPVPAGLRAPTPPEAPSVSGSFTIDGVPGADYHVLAAFENDVARARSRHQHRRHQPADGHGAAAATRRVPESFKVTEALAVIGPGADTPETVSGAPTLRWADDSSEDGYEVVVFDALGNKAWEKLDVPRVTGSANVEVPYEGPVDAGHVLPVPRDLDEGGVPISRTEDLRGVFVIAAPSTPVRLGIDRARPVARAP